MLKTYSTLTDLLDADEQAIHDSYSESAFSKIQEEHEGLLNVTKKKQVSALLLDWEVLRERDTADGSII